MIDFEPMAKVKRTPVKLVATDIPPTSPIRSVAELDRWGSDNPDADTLRLTWADFNALRLDADHIAAMKPPEDIDWSCLGA